MQGGGIAQGYLRRQLQALGLAFYEDVRRTVGNDPVRGVLPIFADLIGCFGRDRNLATGKSSR
jgi:hypothetical protein